MTERLSFCVHSYNEAEALKRLVLSSLPMAQVIDEWVILDHRSDDDTPRVIAELEPILAAQQIHLVALHEDRDLSAEHTFADVRNRTIQACRNPVVALLDADFLLGPVFQDMARAAARELTFRGNHCHAATYAVPCLWDRLSIDGRCTIRDHGRVWVHNRRPRFLLKDAITFEQRGDGGRWEYLTVVDPTKPRLIHLTPTGSRQQKIRRHSVISVNVKSEERIALRDTMTMFMQDAISAGKTGTWLEAYAKGETRNQPPYPYHQVSVRGWRINAPGLELSSAALSGATQPR